MTERWRLTGLLGLLAIGALVLLHRVLLAIERRPDSTLYRWIAHVVAPISRRFVAAPVLPERGSGAAEPAGLRLDSAGIWLQPELVETRRQGDAIVMTPRRECLWWKNVRGPMLYHWLAGDGLIEAGVRARKRTDPAAAPDREWQFGGVMLRNPTSDAWYALENYVFCVVGHRGRSLQIEAKSTRNGISDVRAWDWPSGDAELKVERIGSRFEVFARTGATDAWRPMTSFERPDLPPTLQAGLITYAYSEGRGHHDLSVSFDHVAIR